ncbi:RNA pseudouridylate synthase domain-containing protein 1-like [Papilio machaon]|uniref:RNA pseudouridylate synthase domain-containing protein 1-like n=1 Tax=Papilio machaon TaxID=76193 RepID=UPI001E663DEB|nr:RNA pseudouridylate synthase domain-containing protein 1-like [Papilio machaon]
MAVVNLYKNENFLIVNKPYDMYINSDDENEKNTVVCHIAERDSHRSNSAHPLHFVQRLDYSTSGVLCLALNKNAAATAGRLFEKRLTHKYYLAIVRGHLSFEICDIKYPVGSDRTSPDNGHKMLALTETTTASCGPPRSAETRLLVLESGHYEDNPVTVVLLKPLTGRRHQLRVHCSAIGHTILGDYTYSDRQDVSPHRMFLHATRLVLPLPKEPLDIQTEEPFFSDNRFTSKWTPLAKKYNYCEKQDFIKVCDVIDKAFERSDKYKLFS